jgi:transposase InsO family protein
MHKNTKLLPYQRREIFARWKQGEQVAKLAREYRVSRETVYGTLKDARIGIFLNRSSMNRRYRTLFHGLRHLARKEWEIAGKIARREHRLKRYEKSIPGEMVHVDTKRLPLMRGEAIVQPREYLFVAIDDFSRWVYADILPDKTSYAAAIFLNEALRSMPFRVQCLYSDNGSEYKGTKDHAVRIFCESNRIDQSFTKVKHPWTNGKAERVIRTLMEEWLPRSNTYVTRDERRRHLYAYVDWYNQSRFHQSLNATPLERLETFLRSVNNPLT